MTDIERRLRDLGERVRDEQDAGTLQPETIRSATRRRLATALGATLTVVALVSGVTYAATSLTARPEKIGPAAEDSEPLIGYHRTGGYEGSDTRLTIDLEGHAVLSRTERTVRATIKGVLSESELTDLRGLIATIDWPAVEGAHELSPGVGVADGYEYEIRHEGYVVTTISGAEPRELKPLIEFLDALIEIQRALHEPSEPTKCGPPVDFEPTYLPEGWIARLQEGAALGKDPFGNIAGHYGADGPPGDHRKTDAGFIDLVALGFRFEPRKDGDLVVLGQQAEFDDENGTIEFESEGCAYALVGAGVGREELVPFAEGLRAKGSAGDGPAERCRPAVDFEPTYLPRDWDAELKPGEGGGGFFPGVLGHYTATASSASSETQAGFVDLIAENPPYLQSNKTVITVLGNKAMLGDIHEGYSVEFERGGCDFILVAFGLDRAELRLFAEGLEETR